MRMDREIKKVMMIGIAGNSHSILIAPYILSAYLDTDRELQSVLRTEIRHDAVNHENLIASNLSEDAYYKKFAHESLVPTITEARPDIIAFSTYVWNRAIICYTLEELKKFFQGGWEPIVILGGPEIEKAEITEGCYDAMDADYLIWGEGEIPLLQLLRVLTGLSDDLSGIPRLAFRQDGNGGYSVNEASGGCLNLKEAPSAYLGDMIPESIWELPFLVAGVETQRGCNFRCAYCMYHKNFEGISYRRAETVIDEMKYLYRKGVKIIRVLDANFLSDIDFAVQIFEGINHHRLHFKIFIEVVPVRITEAVGRVLKQFTDASPENELQVGIGLQSINPKSLKSIRRNIPIEAFDKAYDLLLEAGAIIKTDIILGLPFETVDTYLDCLSFIIDKSKKGGSNFFALALLRILPGSNLVEIAETEKITLDQSDGEHYVWSTPSMPHDDLIRCLQFNAAVSRIFHSAELKGENQSENDALCSKFHAVKDRLQFTNQQLLTILAEKMNARLERNNTSQQRKISFRYDYPNRLNPYNQITNEEILALIHQI